MKNLLENNSVLKKRAKRLFKIYLFFLLLILFLSSLYTFLIYNKVINPSITSFNNTSFIIGIICFFILGLISGSSANKNGFLDAFICSLIVIMFVSVLNLFMKEEFTKLTFIKSSIYVLTSSLGGIIGLNMNKKKEK